MVINTDPQLTKVQKTKGCGMLIPKWHIYIISPTPQGPGIIVEDEAQRVLEPQRVDEYK